MTPREMAAIRKRDREADRCRKCAGHRLSLDHAETVEECNARLFAETKGARGCWAPESHHPYEPGGIDEYNYLGAQDRRALLEAMDARG